MGKQNKTKQNKTKSKQNKNKNKNKNKQKDEPFRATGRELRRERADHQGPREFEDVSTLCGTNERVDRTDEKTRSRTAPNENGTGRLETTTTADGDDESSRRRTAAKTARRRSRVFFRVLERNTEGFRRDDEVD